MKFAGNQPYFLPYIGYWQLINYVDVFSVGDDYNYIKGGWINRNRILDANCGTRYLNIEIDHASSNKLINETNISLSKEHIEKKLRIIEEIYNKAPFFNEGYELIYEIFNYKSDNLAEFLFYSINKVCDYLEINTRIIKSSSFTNNIFYKREHRIYEQCKEINASTYVNSIGGIELYSFDEFINRDIKLEFIKPNEIIYQQFDNEFVPNLSILDIIMFNDVPQIKIMLNDFSIICE